MAESYAQDIAFLRERVDVVELEGPDGARLAVTPEYQGRVMTSRLGGSAGAGRGFGWINKPFIASGQEIPRFNNYGGEDRFWLGPEAGQFGLWFRKSDTFDVEHWMTPPAINRGPFAVTSQGADSIVMAREFAVENYSGTRFSCAVQRRVRSLERAESAEMLAANLPGGLSMVAFESKNVLVNSGTNPWRRDGGLLSIWILGQFNPLPRGKVIAPFIAGDEAALGPRATTTYFGDIPAERCRVTSDCVVLGCDGQYRAKIGISKRRAHNVIGSFDPDANVLTIAQFNLPGDAARRPYVNSLWQIQPEPFEGDVVNSYNEGPDYPGVPKPQSFYELESSSPAAELSPGEALTHRHRTFHFGGQFDMLRELARTILHVDLANI